MSLLEQINKEKIKKVIAYSQNIDNPIIDDLMEKWSNNKKGLSNRFLNKNLIYTYPEKIQFELSEDAKIDRFNHFIDFIWNIFNNDRHPLMDFLCDMGALSFYSNSLPWDYTLPDGKKILKGSKVIKSFKYFVEEDRLLRDLQDRASELIQANKVEGYLNFSIHPLDFLSSSENNYNWRSCHALDGEYRAGNLSYIGDSSTMIVYLCPEKLEKLPHFPEDVLWNNKKWRVLLHFDKELEVCFAGRQYPFFSPGALNKVKEIWDKWLTPKYDKYLLPWEIPKREEWAGWYNDYVEKFLYTSTGKEVDIENFNYCVINKGIFNINDIVSDTPDSRHFNDVLRSSCYEKPFYMFKKYWSPQRKIDITVGSQAMCLWCGEEIIKGGDSMMCPSCECLHGDSDSDEYRTCDSCGGRRYCEDGDWMGDEWLCNECIDSETFRCKCCGERAYNSEKHWDDNLKDYICDYCLKERNES